MQGSYFKTGKDKPRKFREDREDQFDKEFQKKKQKYRDERRKQKRSENWSN